MKSIRDLFFGFNDAENYKKRENRDLFSRIFVRNNALERLLEPSTYFLVGEKGTGKTAYSVFLENNSYQNTRARTCYIRETEYQQFIALKTEKHLLMSDYVRIWQVILLVLVAKLIDKDDLKGDWAKYDKLDCLRDAIDDFYNHAFAPEIVTVMGMLRESAMAAELFSDYAKLSAKEKETLKFDESRFQTNLLFLEARLKEAILDLRIQKKLILFIDGIDVRPNDVPFNEYHDCIRGLANAVWNLNNDLFPKLKDSAGGRIKIVLLLRPDIFAHLSLQNQNAKLKDNSVYLDWRTTYKTCQYSELFRLADRIVTAQQEEPVLNDSAWDHYFPYKLSPDEEGEQDHSNSSFISFLRFSFYRPRDIVTMLSILKDLFIEHGRKADDVFTLADFDSKDFRNRYSNYLLGEIKDHLAFYYSDEDYEIFLKFFEYLSGAYKFSYAEYLAAYEALKQFCAENGKPFPSFLETADKFLQFLYDLNVIWQVECDGDKKFYKLCLRERTYSNIAPKVVTKSNYEVHYGIARALHLGKSFVNPRRDK